MANPPVVSTTVITVMQPYVPPPVPPPVPPSPTVTLPVCGLCRSLMPFGYEVSHLTWHRMNNLHGVECAELKGLVAQEEKDKSGVDEDVAIETCNCGLQTNEESQCSTK